jgi:hypothetical protein
MSENFISIKIESEERAKADARRYSKDEQDLFTVIKCHKSNGFYVCGGDGGMIRNFEEIIAQYYRGEIYKP